MNLILENEYFKKVNMKFKIHSVMRGAKRPGNLVIFIYTFTSLALLFPSPFVPPFPQYLAFIPPFSSQSYLHPPFLPPPSVVMILSYIKVLGLYICVPVDLTQTFTTSIKHKTKPKQYQTQNQTKPNQYQTQNQSNQYQSNTKQNQTKPVWNTKPNQTSIK